MADTNLKKNKDGYGYKYTDLAQIHEYLEKNNMSYYQYIESDANGNDYIMTVPIIDGNEKQARKGCRVIQATLNGKSNAAQEQGSGLTYARRYSLLMAFGLATEDDDGATFTKDKKDKNVDDMKYKLEVMKLITGQSEDYKNGICEHYKIKDVSDLTVEQCKDFIEQLNKKGAKKNE